MLDRGEQLGWFDSGEIIAELIISIGGFYYFFAHSLTTREPFINFEMFKDRNFVGGCVFMVVIGMVLFATMALITPFMQNLLGYPILTAGWLLGCARRRHAVRHADGQPTDETDRGSLSRVHRADARPHAVPDDRLHARHDAEHDRHLGVLQGVGLGLVFVPLELSVVPDIAGPSAHLGKRDPDPACATSAVRSEFPS